MNKNALISISNKEGALEFAKSLIDMGWTITSSSGTAKMFSAAGLHVTEVSDLTGYPSILGGRVKTLHPAVFGGILARQDLDTDLKDLTDHNIEAIDIVVCNLYPFEERARDNADLDTLIENIDIGGVTLIRAAAKNHKYVTIVTDPSDYGSIIEELQTNGSVSLETRRTLALKALAATSRYDAIIHEVLEAKMHQEAQRDPTQIPQTIAFAMDVVQNLRYGENPHQKAALYLPPLSRMPIKQLSGKELSYNNILDMDAAMRGVALLGKDTPACVVIKHTTPCGMATGATTLEAYQNAMACDPLSAYGGIVGFTAKLDMETAEELSKIFTELIIIPDFDQQALDFLKNKKPSLRIMLWNGRKVFQNQYVSTWTGMLVQSDQTAPLPTQDDGYWIGQPRPDLWDDMILAWKTAAVSKSNAVAIIKDGQAVGIGMGFCSRLYAVDFAVAQAGEKAKGAVMASDAFFPFPDAMESAVNAGVTAIIQPGGSVGDEKVFARAKELGISMFISNHRTFRH